MTSFKMIRDEVNGGVTMQSQEDKYEAVLNALKVAQCEIEKGGTVDRELVLELIKAALFKAV